MRFEVGLALVLALLALSPGTASTAPTHAVTASAVPATTPNSIQETSVATRSSYEQGTFWQNTSATYGTGSAVPLVPSNLSGLPRSAVFSSSLTVTAGVHGNLVPMLNITQGSGVTLANATVPYSFTVAPLISGTPVKIRIPAAYTQAGQIPMQAVYPAFFNLTQQVSFFYSKAPVWTLTNGSRENLSFQIAVPSGYSLNQTSVFVPFPSPALPNASTFNITTKLGARQTNLTTYQLVAGGVVAYLPALNATVSLNVAYAVAGITQGSTPTIPLGTVYGYGPGWFRANATWVNTRTLPWSGQIFITFNSSVYQIEPGTLTVTANLRPIVNATYSLAGGAIIILPGAVTVASGRGVVFQATFQLIGQVPRIPLCVTCSIGGTPFAWSDLIALVEALLIIYVVARGFRLRRAFAAQGATWSPFRGRESAWWAAVYAFFGILAFYLIAFYAGG